MAVETNQANAPATTRRLQAVLWKNLFSAIIQAYDWDQGIVLDGPMLKVIERCCRVLMNMGINQRGGGFEYGAQLSPVGE